MKRIGIYGRGFEASELKRYHNFAPNVSDQKLHCETLARKLFGSETDIEYYFDKKAPYVKKGRMLEEVINGNLDMVISYQVSLMAELLADALKTAKYIHDFNNVTFITVKEGQYGTPETDLTYHILSTLANQLITIENRRVN